MSGTAQEYDLQIVCGHSLLPLVMDLPSYTPTNMSQQYCYLHEQLNGHHWYSTLCQQPLRGSEHF